MRAYFFTNFYLSSIQKGIQAQHCTADMAVKYRDPQVDLFHNSTEAHAHDSQRVMFFEWAAKNKVTIVLNGGSHGDLDCLSSEFEIICERAIRYRIFIPPYPFALFREDESSLNNAITCFGVVLPQEIYETADRIRDREDILVREMLDDPQYCIVNRLPSTELDRFIIDKLLECSLAI